MNKIKYLVGKKKISSYVFEPYDPILCEFLDNLSSEIRSDKRSRNHPDIMTFAFWCRKANINQKKREINDGKKRIGLGKVFHITPSNVPINFAVSFVFGLLSGNANIVRVPSKPYPQIEIVCDCLNRLFKNKKYNKIKEMTAFINYSRSNEITGAFSKDCNARIVWGGDSTIRNIRQLPIQERCVEVVFSDRYSICVINPNSIAPLNKTEMNRLTELFYNDTYLMDQNACSSPHLIIWLGQDNKSAKENFWKALSDNVATKYKLEEISAMDKYTKLCHDAINFNNIKSFKKIKNYVYRIDLNNLPNNMDELRGKCGYFYEYNTEDINSIAHIINNRYQTLTYYGVDKDLLLNFVVKNCLLGIDRIVPIGQALDIDVIWDGYDIIRRLSRIIDIK